MRSGVGVAFTLGFAGLAFAACGDCDGDGAVTILDALAAAQHAAGLITLTGQQFIDCDVDRSGSVQILDALLLAQAAAGLPVTLTCASGRGWQQRSPAVAPSPRFEHGMCYDAARQVVVLFGGKSPPVALLDTWEYDGNDWTQVFPATTPSEFFSNTMVYDPVRQRSVLTGSYWGIVTSYDETWEWDGNDWTQRLPPSSSPHRDDPAFMWDATNQVVSLFAGGGMSGIQMTTSEWNGADWAHLPPNPTAPPARMAAAMAHDPVRARAVLFGGVGAVSTLGDTWEHSGFPWTQLFPATSPPARSAHAMVYDIDRGVTFLFGGTDGATLSPPLDWEWDGVDWTQTMSVPAPPARSDHAMVYDSVRNRIVCFGGRGAGGSLLGDTWEY